MTVKDVLNITSKQERKLLRVVNALRAAFYEELTQEQISWAISNTFPDVQLSRRHIPTTTLKES